MTITDINDVPAAAAGGPYVGYEGSPVVLDGTACSDVDGMVMTWMWDCENDGVVDITSTSGVITINADNAGNTADVTMADGTVINAGSGTIDIDADVDVTLGSLSTTSASTTAVTITQSTIRNPAPRGPTRS